MIKTVYIRLKRRAKQMIIDIRSPVSAYVKINGYTIYIEVSSATDNIPYTSYWLDSDDRELENTSERLNK